MMGSLTIAKRMEKYPVPGKELRLLRGAKMNDKWLDFAIRIQSIGCTLLYPQRRLESRKHMKKNDDIIAFVKTKCS